MTLTPAGIRGLTSLGSARGFEYSWPSDPSLVAPGTLWPPLTPTPILSSAWGKCWTEGDAEMLHRGCRFEALRLNPSLLLITYTTRGSPQPWALGSLRLHVTPNQNKTVRLSTCYLYP
jgi:hypothetical protein